MSTQWKSFAICLLVGWFAGCASCGGENNENNVTPNNDADMTMVDPDMPGDEDMGMTDMDPPDPDMGMMEENVITCANQIAPAASGLCDATTGTSDFVLFEMGEVLASDVIYENGTVLVDQSSGEIACVGCDCGDDANAAAATVVSCGEGVLSPSLINPHDHVTFSLSWPQPHGEERFEHRHDWRRGIRGHSEVNVSPGRDASREGVLYGELRMLLGGATSIAGSSGSTEASGLLRNLDVLDDLDGLTGIDVDYRTFPLGDSGGDLISTGCDYPDIDSGNRVNNSGIYLPHIAEGIDEESNNEFRCLSSDMNGGVDLVEENTSIIHGIGLTVPDIAEIAANGAKLVWSPRSNIDLYGNTARVTTFQEFGITIALGTDWSASGSMNMLRELQCADYLNSTHYDRSFTDRELWQMATYNAAVAMGADNQIGVIRERFVADLAIFDGRENSSFRAVIDAETADVHMVMRGGTPLYGDANLVEALVPSAEIDLCETIDICGENRRLCLERDTALPGDQLPGLDLAGLRSSVDQGAYPLYFCDTPEQEPSCVPARPNEYTGVTSDTDADGDGIEDSTDLCPAVFTPVRPLDDGTQPDFDNDGTGDDCDSCPQADDDMCPMLDPDDRDADGVTNFEDNCPADPNPDQANADGDQFGDVCDPCSDFDNTDTTACPATVYEIRDGTFSVGDEVFIDEVIVTAVSDSAFFVQVPDSASYYDGLPNSGLYIYRGSGGPTLPAVGDIISVSGRIDIFGDTLELADLTDITVDSSGNTLPAFTEVTSTEIGTGGSRTAELEATLVRVRDVTVTDANPDDPDDFNEFEVDGVLRIDDLFYLIEPDPTVGDEFAILQGVLNYSFGNSKLVPRSMADVVTGPPSLTGLEPGDVFIKSGNTGSTIPPLQVVLTGPSLGVSTVDLTYSGGVTGPATVDVPDGDDRIEVTLTSATANGTVTASFDGQMSTTNVTVYDDTTVREVTDLTPATNTLSVNGMLTLTVTLSVPAPTGGQNVDIAYSPGNSLSGPATVTVPEDGLAATFDVTAGATASSETVTASIGASMQSATVEVIVGSANCLIISEYIEGSGSNNKAFELYNCAPAELDLTNFAVCLVSNTNTTCNATASLSGTLAVGDVLTICKTTSGSAGDPVDGIANNCTTELSSVANFNGNDRIVVFEDVNGDNQLDSGDEVTDAFGQIAVEPGDIWANTTYRRCDFTQTDGVGAFDVDTLYTSHPEDDAANYGTAPTEGCP